MAVKRKVVGTEHSEVKLRTRSDEQEEVGKKRRVDANKDLPDTGAAPVKMEEDVVLTRCIKVEEAEKIIKVEVGVLKDGPATDLFDDGEASKDLSDEENLEEERLRYEEERNRILEENRKRMQELGLPDLTNQLCPTYRTRTHLKSALAANGKKNQMKHKVDAGFQPRRSARYASRGDGSKLPTTIDLVNVKEEPRENLPRRSKPKTVGASTRGLELYTEEHIKLLGSYAKEWKLFRDGVHPGGGGRIYDSENGKTCHQCRQKTLGRRTSCGVCKARSGQFCGDCLFMRYGENVLEANANTKWACPVCRGICNCSVCRIRRGWAPTGNLYRYALAEGFKSVAHYLIMTRQLQAGCEGEKVGQAGGSNGVDHVEIAMEEVHQKDIEDSNLQPKTPSPTRRLSRSDSKIVKEEVIAPSGELQHSKALRLEEKFLRVESQSFVMAKVEIKLEIQVEESTDGPGFCKKRTPAEREGLVEDASQLLDAQKKWKGVEGTNDLNPGDLMIGDIRVTETTPEEEKTVIAPGDAALPTSPRSACHGPNKSSVAVKEEPICIAPVFPLSEDAEACCEETLKFQGTETSVKGDTPAKKIPGRTRAEVVRERMLLKGSSQLSSLEMLPRPAESICNRLRRKEVINYKRFL